MDINCIPDNPYLLLTPGPLSTTKTVRAAMLEDWCTWDEDYNKIVRNIRDRLTALSTGRADKYTAVLMQGSGTFCVESTIGSAVRENGKLLALSNGSYGSRIAQIAERLKIPLKIIEVPETSGFDADQLIRHLEADGEITHVAAVHCETTTGMLNDIAGIGNIVSEYGKVFIVDAMSSFGGIPIDLWELKIDFMISSANKCIQDVPGFGFVIAKRRKLEMCEGVARSVALDLFDQWRTMEQSHGKWRFTSPTHAVRAFFQALQELEEEGGVRKRFERYAKNQRILAAGMEKHGFMALLEKKFQSPIITSFLYPDSIAFDFQLFYQKLKSRGFVIYPGKTTKTDTFRIGSIGDVYEEDMVKLIEAVAAAVDDFNIGRC
jgi:2-aminoethylphosphonate-pyruvate transaminase